jgi:hypothetical protein
LNKWGTILQVQAPAADFNVFATIAIRTAIQSRRLQRAPALADGSIRPDIRQATFGNYAPFVGIRLGVPNRVRQRMSAFQSLPGFDQTVEPAKFFGQLLRL